jgi:hypothetical protein
MNQASYFQSHPPRCLAGFSTRNAELPDVPFDGHGEQINPIFALSCKCGSARHFIHCYRWSNPEFNNAIVILSPLVLECANCKKKTALLDTNIHGYDAELGNGSTTARAEGDQIVFECPKCGRQPFEVFVRFEYPDDLFDGNIRKFAGRQQELFSWFSLVGKCAQCSTLVSVTDFECA